MQDKSVEFNTTTLAAAVDITTAAVVDMAGNAMTNRVNGEVVSPAILSDVVAARLGAALNKRLGAKQ